MDQRIEIAREVAMSYIGTYYKWGGDDPSGFDCSGFVIEILKSVGAFPRQGDATAAGLFARYARANEPDLGNLVFYGTSNGVVKHVEFCLGKGLAIGASGGGSRCTNNAMAIQLNAYIKIRPIKSRIGILGYSDPFQGWRDENAEESD
jgi:D-gamma-glutamyl-meso-diaminopimelic acid endopeptidase CwlS